MTERHVEVARARWPDSTRESLQAGRSLYVSRCSGCHTLYVPSKYAADEWPSLVEEMKPKAKLDAAGVERVTRYLVVASETR